ncbi:DUF5787 family protein [Haloferacaceae archaeon DSL9]
MTEAAEPTSEFTFELLACRWAELSWPPSGDRETTHIVARQLGTKRRRWDTVVVEADADALARRERFGEDELDADLLFLVRHAPDEWAWYRDALPHPGYPWRYVREAIHRASDRGVLDTRRRGNRIEIRSTAPYPDWVRRIIAIENKPDLNASAARALQDQLEHDISSGLADEVWLATRRTDAAVEPALLEAMPVEVGVVTLDFERGVTPASGSVAWHPTRTGTDRTETQEATRRKLAERAYGRGWRRYHETMRPDCRHFELRRAGRGLLPWCAAKGRSQTAAACSWSCSAFEPEPPAWRTRGWPIDGGPGNGIKALLRSRRGWVQELNRETA